MARWNRLDQPEQPGQAAIQTTPTPGRPEAFVRTTARLSSGHWPVLNENLQILEY
jgi:hypothetical protein